jgi:exo-beta-1,3-glucanase (GH17 family)
LKSNAKAKFVTRAVQFGSEPLYDWAIYAGDLATEVKNAKSSLSSLGIPVTVSEMAYGYQVVSQSKPIPTVQKDVENPISGKGTAHLMF